MFLPNQLPNGLRRSSAVAELEAEAEEMGGGKQRRATDRDEMLAPTSPQAQQQQLQTSAHSQSAGFVARSWDRISGRRRRQKRRMVAEERRNLRLATTSTTLEAGQQPDVEISQHQQQQQPSGSERLQSWPGGGGGGNLTGLAHLEEIGPKKHIIGRGMDRLRRSIRRTLQRGSQAGQALTHGGSSAAADVQASSSNGPGGGGSGFSKNYCHSDEIAVRSAACSFPVKYLGCCEVFESRGMSVCESALQHLRSRKRTIKALLYVSGDGVRVVDQENNRGLIVDQTIEKVSFCSPDRHNEKGFAYICRDGATRRWMCHGFHATKDSGERLSHAVGCAFTVCLEKKRKRDAETAAFKSAQALATSLNSGGGGQQSPASESNEPNFARTNQGYRSFRPLSISERRADPQKAILVQQQRPQSGIELGGGGGLAATPRPTGNPNLFERTGSLRGPASAAPPMPGPKPVFSRFNTLASGADPRGSLPKISLHNEPIWEGEDDGTEETRVQQHFYRTLPHSLPNFGHKVTNWPLSSATSIPPTIPEEDKLLQQPPPVPDSSNSPPADPFTEEDPQQPKVRADNWLEQTFQRAASISYSSSALPRSLTMNWPPLAATQPAVPQWTQFPQSQSLQTAQDWADGAAAYQPKCQPPTQPPPSLPASCWLEPAPARGFEFDQSPSNSNSGQTSKSPKWSNAQAQQQPATPSDRREEADQPTAAVMKNHSRKAPGSRRIEYQLLQETDVSLSPPKSNGGGSGPAAMPSTASTAADPFDVNWSQKVLEETTKQRHHNGGGGGQQQQQRKAPAQESSGERQQPNPFGWDMAPSAAVDV